MPSLKVNAGTVVPLEPATCGRKMIAVSGVDPLTDRQYDLPRVRGLQPEDAIVPILELHRYQSPPIVLYRLALYAVERPGICRVQIREQREVPWAAADRCTTVNHCLLVVYHTVDSQRYISVDPKDPWSLARTFTTFTNRIEAFIHCAHIHLGTFS